MKIVTIKNPFILKNLKNLFRLFIDLKFAIFILALIAFTSSLGSFIPQDETIGFYEKNYQKPIYGFIDSNFILTLGLDHIYTAPWFLLLLVILGVSLIGCSFTRQFPLFFTSQEYSFKKNTDSYLRLPFFNKIQNIYYLKETIINKLRSFQFYIYQKGDLIYAYKGLIGRISPILVHLSLIIILLGSSISAFFNFKAQEVSPKGELFHLENLIRVGWLTEIPRVNTRINDFWVEYQNNRIHQFYSNVSILDNFGNEIHQQTISVNNPLRYKGVDFYQSDWNLIGVRIKNLSTNKIYEFPLFQLSTSPKSWITWVSDTVAEQLIPEQLIPKEQQIILIDQLENSVTVYSEDGKFLGKKQVGDTLTLNSVLIDILPSSGLLIKYDPSINIIYSGFALLMLTACLSYLPYNQIWVFNQKRYCFLGSSTNRGKISLEIEFENFIRSLEYYIAQLDFNLKSND